MYGAPDFDGYDPRSVLADRAPAPALDATWEAALEAAIAEAKARRSDA